MNRSHTSASPVVVRTVVVVTMELKGSEASSPVSAS